MNNLKINDLKPGTKLIYDRDQTIETIKKCVDETNVIIEDQNNEIWTLSLPFINGAYSVIYHNNLKNDIDRLINES